MEGGGGARVRSEGGLRVGLALELALGLGEPQLALENCVRVRSRVQYQHLLLEFRVRFRIWREAWRSAHVKT